MQNTPIISRCPNQQLAEKLESYAADDEDYWSFQAGQKRKHVHNLFQYPAMMVPDILSVIVDDVQRLDPGVQRMYDPFMGSATALTEAMLNGLSFVGRDINPLAVLIAKTKAAPLRPIIEGNAVEATLQDISRDRYRKVEVDFSGRDKWFQKKVQVDLSKIVRAIRLRYKRVETRRFLWVCMAETIRRCSNSRTSTFKLHIRPKPELRRTVDTIDVFRQVCAANLQNLKILESHLQQNNLLNDDGAYRNTVDVSWGDSINPDFTPEANSVDLLTTSPPYGDNHTTVPYGQHSFLPLQWIDWNDIDPTLNPNELMSSTHSLDTQSVGGSRRNALSGVQPVLELSPTLQGHLDTLADQPRDRRVRISAFFRDFNRVLTACIPTVRVGGYLVWVVGNRMVGGKLVPFDEILSELLEVRGVQRLCSLERSILSKRIAPRNNVAKTLTREHILVLQRVR